MFVFLEKIIERNRLSRKINEAKSKIKIKESNFDCIPNFVDNLEEIRLILGFKEGSLWNDIFIRDILPNNSTKECVDILIKNQKM